MVADGRVPGQNSALISTTSMRLVVDELLDAEAKQYAAIAGVADTAERQIGPDHSGTVDRSVGNRNRWVDCCSASSVRSNVNQSATFVRRGRVPTDEETNVSPIDLDLHG
jgi:hypothetical protein